MSFRDASASCDFHIQNIHNMTIIFAHPFSKIPNSEVPVMIAPIHVLAKPCPLPRRRRSSSLPRSPRINPSGTNLKLHILACTLSITIANPPTNSWPRQTDSEPHRRDTTTNSAIIASTPATLNNATKTNPHTGTASPSQHRAITSSPINPRAR